MILPTERQDLFSNTSKLTANRADGGSKIFGSPSTLYLKPPHSLSGGVLQQPLIFSVASSCFRLFGSYARVSNFWVATLVFPIFWGAPLLLSIISVAPLLFLIIWELSSLGGLRSFGEFFTCRDFGACFTCRYGRRALQIKISINPPVNYKHF